jgi:hypothetical protein
MNWGFAALNPSHPVGASVASAPSNPGHPARCSGSTGTLLKIVHRQPSHIAAAAGSLAGRSHRLFPGAEIDGPRNGPAGSIGRSIHEGTNVIASAFDDYVLGPTALDENLATLVDASSLPVLITERQVNRPDAIGKPTQRKIDSALNAVLYLVCQCELLGHDA